MKQIQFAELVGKVFEIPQCQREQASGRTQSTSMLGMRWLLEVFLQMHKRPGSLNQRLIKTSQLRVFFHQPKLFEHIVGFIIFLCIPQLKNAA